MIIFQVQSYIGVLLLKVALTNIDLLWVVLQGD